MPQAVRLVTQVDAQGDDPRRLSVSARLDAVLDNGRVILLLDGRGWTQEMRGPGASEIADVWAITTADEIARTARSVVGPDEPFGGRSHADMERDHWSALAAALQAQGVFIDGDQLSRLPHEVALSDRLRARLGTA